MGFLKEALIICAFAAFRSSNCDDFAWDGHGASALPVLPAPLHGCVLRPPRSRAATTTPSQPTDQPPHPPALQVRDLDDITFTEWFTQLEGPFKGSARGSIDRMWDPIAYALGFIDCDHISARAMLTIFMLFAIRTEASVLRMLEGSPQTYLHDPIVKYVKRTLPPLLLLRLLLLLLLMATHPPLSLSLSGTSRTAT